MSSARFLIFSTARSGSTTLETLLNCHTSIRCLHEPFNLNSSHRAGSPPPEDVDSLHRELEEIWRSWNGIKHVWTATGWPFAPGSTLNQELLRAGRHRILFLRRRNALRRAVSDQISKQAQVWGSSDREKATVRSFSFQPLDIEEIEESLKGEREQVVHLKRVITESGKPSLELWYEDLFESGLDFAQQGRKLDEIVQFLAFTPMPDSRLIRERIHALFDPVQGKLNSTSTYRGIPGIDEIEHRFGSDEYGWLFR